MAYDYIKFHGLVSQKEIMLEFQKAEYWFYPTSYYETYCNSALEAQLHGCVCIATDLGGLHTTVGDRGVLIDSETINNKIYCVNKVIQVMKDYELKKDLSERGKQYSSSQTWENSCNKWIDMFCLT